MTRPYVTHVLHLRHGMAWMSRLRSIIESQAFAWVAYNIPRESNVE